MTLDNPAILTTEKIVMVFGNTAPESFSPTAFYPSKGSTLGWVLQKFTFPRPVASASPNHQGRTVRKTYGPLLETPAYERAETERFIRRVFQEHHGAQVRHFFPRILSSRDSLNQPQLAVGVRSAQDGPLFLEQYLDEPIERLLGRLGPKPVNRASIVEIGNLAALDAGATRWAIRSVTNLLFMEGFQWVTFTGTTALRNCFAKLGLQPLDLGPASLSKLPIDERPDWGDYFEQAPRVACGRIAEGYERLSCQR